MPKHSDHTTARLCFQLLNKSKEHPRDDQPRAALLASNTARLRIAFPCRALWAKASVNMRKSDFATVSLPLYKTHLDATNPLLLDAPKADARTTTWTEKLGCQNSTTPRDLTGRRGRRRLIKNEVQFRRASLTLRPTGFRATERG